MVNEKGEIVHCGWLTKSPPQKRLLKVRWRKRFFVLRSGELPGQYILEYFVDETCKKRKGKIDLDQCEQVDAGIMLATEKETNDNNFMFDIKTPSRIYYLRCDTELEMNRWVDCLCQVCGLKAQIDDPLQPNSLMPAPLPPLTAPMLPPLTPLTQGPPIDMLFSSQDSGLESNVSPSTISSISGPYIPISECITGRKGSTNVNNQVNNNLSAHGPGGGGGASRFPFHTSPGSHKRLNIPTEIAPAAPLAPSSLNPSLTSLATTSSSASTLVADDASDNKRLCAVPQANNTGAKPRVDPHDMQRASARSSSNNSEASSRLRGRSTASVADDGSFRSPLTDTNSSVFADEDWPSHSLNTPNTWSNHVRDGDHVGAPPRPPKPPHLEVPQQNYMNIEPFSRTSCSRKNSTAETSTRKVSANHDVTSSDAEPSPLSACSSLASANTPLTEGVQELSQLQVREGSSDNQKKLQQQQQYYNSATVPSSVTSERVFSYDLRGEGALHHTPAETDLYSNVPGSGSSGKSPANPPCVNRGLKPKISTNSDTSDVSPLDVIHSASSAGVGPAVARHLKPNPKLSTSSGGSGGGGGGSSASSSILEVSGVPKEFVLDPPPRSRPKTRAAPSPTPPASQHHRSEQHDPDSAPPPMSAQSWRSSGMHDDHVFYSLSSVKSPPVQEIQYLDLDLNMKGVSSGSASGGQSATSHKKDKTHKKSGTLDSTDKAAASSGKPLIKSSQVEYQCVDFVKTEALNRLKKDIEESYKNNQS